VTTVVLVAAVVMGALIAETRLSVTNEREIKRRGGFAPPGDVYRAMAVLYPSAFVAMATEGIWRASKGIPAADAGPNWLVSGALLFVVSKALKYWAIRTLGDRWTFRVYVVPDRPLVSDGPYRYIAHPNYVGVLGELVSTAMMCGAPIAGAASVTLFGAVLWMRVRFESNVLRRVAGNEWK
jgi:methyltransferase